MSIKSLIARQFAKYIHHKTQKWATHPVATQQKVFRELIQQAKSTQFGQDHHFDQIHTFKDFAQSSAHSSCVK